MRLEGLCHQPLQAGAVCRINASGSKEIFLHMVERVHVSFKCSASLMVVGEDGNLVSSEIAQVSKSARLMLLAMRERFVSKALRLNGADDSKTWVGLYRILEVVIQDTGGETEFLSHCWGSKRDFKRFKHSANSDAIAGDAARHGKIDTSLPKEPMTIGEAQAYVNYILESWLASKPI